MTEDGDAIVLTHLSRCGICGQEIWTTDEYDDMDDPITFCDPQCPQDGETESGRHEDE